MLGTSAERCAIQTPIGTERPTNRKMSTTIRRRLATGFIAVLLGKSAHLNTTSQIRSDGKAGRKPCSGEDTSSGARRSRGKESPLDRVQTSEHTPGFSVARKEEANERTACLSQALPLDTAD
jgi:hypothetical protein